MTVITRRKLLTAGAILGAAAAGSLVAALTRPAAKSMPPIATPAPTKRSQLLSQALAREQMLIAAIDTALSSNPALHTLVDNVKADHLAHATALRELLGAAAGAVAPSAAPTVTPPPDQGALRSSEQRAQDGAAIASTSLSGTDAVLLASISACEAGHVQLLI